MARAQEYTGFIPASNPIDWAKLTGGLVKTITGIGEEREAQRQALDKLQSDNTKILQNTELGKSQNLNQLILAGSNQGRESMMEWNRQLKAGQITPLEYKNRINNLMDSWSTFANTAKGYDQQMQEALKRQQEGIGSGLELELNNRLAQLGDLRNKKTQVDPNNGNFVIGQLDQNGLFDPSSIRDLRSISQTGNIIDNKVDLSSIVDEKTKGWESWTIELGAKTVTDALQNPAVQRARLDLANGILNNPRAITSVLKDNTDGDYDFYYSGEDLNSKLQDRVAKENELNKQLGKPALSGDALNKFIESEQSKFILLSQDDQGVYQPNLTNKQLEDAKQTVLDSIDARLERKVELDEPQYRGGGGGERGSTKSDDFAVSTYIASNKALEQGDFSNLDNDQYNFSQGIDSSGKKYVLVSSRAYNKREGTYSDDPKAKKIRVYTADGLAQYIKGIDKLKNLPTSIYNSGKNDFFKLNNYTLPGRYEKGQSSGQSNDPLGLGI
jgi:hypothetical protein